MKKTEYLTLEQEVEIQDNIRKELKEDYVGILKDAITEINKLRDSTFAAVGTKEYIKMELSKIIQHINTEV